MKKFIKIGITVIIIAVICFILFIVNALYGNPVSLLLAKNGAKKYTAKNYSDYQLTSAAYNLKINGYCAYVEVPDSLDRHFTVYTDMLGRVRSDSYDDVTSGFNTWERLNDEYRTRADEVFEAMGDYFISFGEMKEEIDIGSLEIDGEYDIDTLAEKYGSLTVYIIDEDVGFTHTAELLIFVRESFDEAKVPFNTIDFVLLNDPKTSDNVDEIHISGFKYVDITQNGLESRIEKAHNELTEYYAELDAEKGYE